jgi:hypothetical protein
VVCDGGQHRDIELPQIQILPAGIPTGIRRGPDRGRIGGPRAQHPALGDADHLVGAGFQIGGEIGDQQVKRCPLPHDTAQIRPRDGVRRGKEHRLDPAHPCAPALLGWQIGQIAVDL